MNEKKPFPCDSKDCTESFNTEHRLKVHVQKHEMLLNLEIPDKANIYSDQTPTPTRLIKNCEEVGLFEDLQHVNPFDETFRNACKIEPNLLHSVSDLYGEELHTPQIYPQFQHTVPKSATSKEPLLLRTTSGEGEEDVIKNIPKKRKYQEEIVEKNSSLVVKVDDAARLPKIHIIEVESQVPNSEKKRVTTIKLPIIAVTNLETPTTESPPDVRSKCCDTIKKWVLGKQKNNGTTPGVVKKVETLKKTIPLKPAVKPKEKEATKTKDGGSNREAAKRYREKMKKVHIELNHKTAQLEEENAQLKKELRYLKTLAIKCTCGVFQKSSPDVLHQENTESVAEPPEQVSSQMALKRIVEKHKPILPALPPQHIQATTSMVVAGTLRNCANLEPVYLVLTSANGDQIQKKSS